MIGDITEKLCEKYDEDDSIERYINFEKCCMDCIELINVEFFEDEMGILLQAKDIWNGTYCRTAIDELHLAFPKRYGLEGNTRERNFALDAAGCGLMSFERWHPEEHERPNLLDYCVFYLLNAGVPEDSLHNVIKKHFPEIKQFS